MGKKILIIDDNEQDRKIIERFLKKAGFRDIVFAERGEEGIEKAKSEKPGVIILDTQLPDINGFQVCKKIKAIKGLSAKVVMSTGQIDAVDAIKAREMGADEYSVKTTDYADLLEVVKKLFA